MLALKIIYILNIIVAGQIAFSAISNPKNASLSIFGNAYQATEVIKLVGCLWLAIAILSIFGLWKPLTFSPVLILQLIYKGSWLIVVALPAFINNSSFPKAMAVFFILWVLALPFIIPWSYLMKSLN